MMGCRVRTVILTKLVKGARLLLNDVLNNTQDDHSEKKELMILFCQGGNVSSATCV